jgi:hypothetical protein
MATTTTSKKRVLIWGLLGLVLGLLGVAAYLERSWSNTLRTHDIVSSSQRDSLTGVRRDTSYLVPRK